MAWCPEYVTGYPIRHSDAPPAVGCIFLDYFPGGYRMKHMIPLTVVCNFLSTSRLLFGTFLALPFASFVNSANSSQTLESESLESAVAGKIKLMLAELYMHLHRSGAYADKLPHQETYLFGMHGSRFHVFRAWFPGPKCSAIWCGKKELPVWRKVLPMEPPKTNNDPAEIKRYDEAVQQAMNEYLTELGGEPEMRTFRVVASREFDLWKKSDFREAVKTVVAVFTYFMSGQARMGTLTDAFQCPPDLPEDESDDSDEKDVVMKQEETVQESSQKENEPAQLQSQQQPQQDSFQRPAVTDSHHPYPYHHHSLYKNADAAKSGILHGIDPLNNNNDDSLNHYLESRWLADFVDDDDEEDDSHGDDEMDDSDDNEYAKQTQQLDR